LYPRRLRNIGKGAGYINLFSIIVKYHGVKILKILTLCFIHMNLA
jgi:hypothetical protein